MNVNIIASTDVKILETPAVLTDINTRIIITAKIKINNSIGINTVIFSPL